MHAGWSDWLDGWLARRLNQQSTIGTYLDPLADKVLICCIVTALGVQVVLPPPTKQAEHICFIIPSPPLMIVLNYDCLDLESRPPDRQTQQTIINPASRKY